MVSRRFGVVVLALLASSASADEDAKKLRGLKPPVFSPEILRGPIFPGQEGPYEAKGIILQSQVPINILHSSSSNAADCWGYVSPSGREYAAIGVQKGTAFVEITDPNNPVVIKFIPGPDSLWHDVAIVGPYAYTCSEGGSGIGVIDLTQIDAGIVTHVQDKMQNGHSSSHTLIQNTDSDDYIYLCGTNINNGGLTAVSLKPTALTPTASPTNPVIAGAWTGHYVHEATAVTYTSGPYAGREIVFCCGGDSGGWTAPRLSIIDVTDKSNMHMIGQCTWPNAGYSHQGWLSADRKYFYLDDELDDWNFGVTSTTHVIDIQDLANPHQVATFTNGNTAIDHNLYVHKGKLFSSNYSSGLRVFDLDAPLAGVEIAFFDTRPEDNVTDFNGNWGNYPFFPSGNIILSDMQRGLFVVRLECKPDCEQDGDLDVFDFLCFQNAFAANLPYADWEEDGDWDVFDFLAFQNSFAAGCD